MNTKLASPIEPSKNTSATMLPQIAEIVKSLVGNEYLYFDHPLILNRGCDLQYYTGICASPQGEVFVLKRETYGPFETEDWHRVNEGSIIESPLFNKVKQESKKYRRA